MTTTLPGETPGTPASKTPRPPFGLSKTSAPTCVAIRPATSLMGTSKGSDPDTSTVSYAIEVILDLISASVHGFEAAKCKYVKRI